MPLCTIYLPLLYFCSLTHFHLRFLANSSGSKIYSEATLGDFLKTFQSVVSLMDLQDNLPWLFSHDLHEPRHLMLDITSHLTAYLEWYFRILLVLGPVTFGYFGHPVLA